ncbi:MAG: hypothetical protein H6741_27825 [Alphaproteobacteria bacterium]|nr:hypothetical protein [Alphaproteobacteria bacterium]MCB9796524.1 hypothetical protein [Alphaproteobacteria bacterium]
MIRLELGPEPIVLRQERDARLPAVIDKWNAWQASKATAAATNADTDKKKAKADQEAFSRSIVGYRVCVDDLYRLQFGKCAYCERATGKAGSPVEHVRPKKGAQHENTVNPGRDLDRYWWLAWTWHNLLFACVTCNSQANKGNRFPLADGSPVVSAPTAPASLPFPSDCFDVGVENRLFIHPREDEPLAHLEWAPSNRAASPSTWRFTVTGKTEKGAKTIKVLELEAVLENIQTHLRMALWPWVEEIEAKRASGDLDSARQTWQTLCKRLLDDPQVPFRGPCYWAMRHVWDRLGWSQFGFIRPNTPFVRH